MTWRRANSGLNDCMLYMNASLSYLPKDESMCDWKDTQIVVLIGAFLTKHDTQILSVLLSQPPSHRLQAIA